MPTDPQIVAGRFGAYKSWSRTVDRGVRTAPARAAGPGSIDYWLSKLDPDLFADATDKQKLDAADAKRREFYARLAYKSAQARRRRAERPPDAP
jgi:hypothetical protein